jgi:hypothetical protein
MTLKMSRPALLNPSVSSRLKERFLFNFRVSSDVIENRLPVNWLRPRVVNGWGIVSFCILKLEHVVLRPFPSLLGLSTISCAYRCSVIDASDKRPTPSVYIPSRSTDLAIASYLGPAIFSGAMPVIRTQILHKQDFVDIEAHYLDGRSVFSARVQLKNHGKLDSKLFGSFEELREFIKGGTSSYTPSTKSGLYSRVDLEENSKYEPVTADIDYECLDPEWRNTGLVFDSALRATGGYYDLKYMGCVPTQSERCLDT